MSAGADGDRSKQKQNAPPAQVSAGRAILNRHRRKVSRMLIDKTLYQEVQRIVKRSAPNYPRSLETWEERVVALSYFSFSVHEATAIVRCCAQVADAADAVATLTGRTPFGDHVPWRSKVEDSLKLDFDESHPVFLACAQRADALELFWDAVTVEAAIVTA